MLQLFTGQNGEVQYSLVSNLGNSLPFKISIQTGVISTVKTLDREDVSFYDVTLVASDLGSPALSSLVPLYIYITDVNDNFPIFNLPPSTDLFSFKVCPLLLISLSFMKLNLGGPEEFHC